MSVPKGLDEELFEWLAGLVLRLGFSMVFGLLISDSGAITAWYIEWWYDDRWHSFLQPLMAIG